MGRNRLTHVPRIFVRLLRALSFTVLAIPISAQVVPEYHVGRGFGPAYNAAKESTLVGTIQEVITEHGGWNPSGIHLLVAGLKGIVDAHVGPFMAQETKQTLHAGATILVVGVTVQLPGKEYSLVRELSVGGRTVTIRNGRGCLIYPHSADIVKTEAAAKAEGEGAKR